MLFPADIKRSMKDCILALFWPKEEIIRFFQDTGCVESDLKDIRNYKEKNLGRRKIVDIIFDALTSRTDNGLGQFRAILKSLTEWKHFDSYYFEQIKQLDKAEAIKKIQELKSFQEKNDAKLKIKDSTVSKIIDKPNIVDLKNRYLSLFSEKITPQKRGYELEKVLTDLCKHCNLETTQPYKIIGEQIDGAIKFDGEHYLIEAKWHDKSLSNEPLYQFALKTDGKMYGRGIFISVNGYSTETVQALTTGKSIKTILVDGADLIYVLEEHLTFSQMIDRKVKAAQTRGEIYIDCMTGKSKKH